MKKLCTLSMVFTFTVLSAGAQDHQPEGSSRIPELDDYWADVSRCVKEGDFVGQQGHDVVAQEHHNNRL
jgi:hypothetical protein